MAGGQFSRIKVTKSTRIARAMQLRIAGNSFRRIAELIQSEFKQRAIDSLVELGMDKERIALELSVNNPIGKYNHVAARRDVQSGLSEVRSEAFDDAKTLRDMECIRLDNFLNGVYDLACRGNFDAIDRALRISEMRVKLLGLNGPIDIRIRELADIKVEHTMNEFFKRIDQDQALSGATKERLIFLASSVDDELEDSDDQI